ncbi:type II toxin-antitoxin system HicA family toxin [Salmonella enterica]|uniref:Type II toxin-antitoxin system HicA family toxin n=1 Tax=Salmonella enterica I TaxID=59201 RepID=A0A7Z1T1X2_SALET|nr:type II toxin-antitoxin system HicA family toxin [Salmonella enterica]EAT5390131.1 type II toxin-antitoxin system HicA family toxin [Salmonella enterica]EBB5477344.1 type II toxin-antitoxin system HicA family toxin [Salmonella enterica]EDX6844809.1 type II toxin-antitoxin system HicA family toxin [Salmonella enterica]EGL1721287.1 type II toxin-antitoxin system HicA family toxin [Salmonella enterica]EGM6571517.1 type II toxin-antitoxin system HicA family toxin [Salmonella enterica]
MNKRHQKTLSDVFSRPVSGTIKWSDIESMLVALGAEVHEREGSRVAVFLKGEKKIFHRPHPRPTTDKGAVNSIRIWLEALGVKP